MQQTPGVTIALLIGRLTDIAETLKHHRHGLGLLALGSAGDQGRMDCFSDLDFFAIVAPGCKWQFIENLNWLSEICDIAYAFRNSRDGYKLLFSDGVFCEFAVFEPQELGHIPYETGQFIWRDDSLPESLAAPAQALPTANIDEDFLLGELLTNLYVGLCRYRRGEWCSAMRFVQVYALDRLISLLDISLSEERLTTRDGFCVDRRVELRHPAYLSDFKVMLSGVEDLPLCAQHMLDFVRKHYEINPAMAARIMDLVATP